MQASVLFWLGMRIVSQRHRIHLQAILTPRVCTSHSCPDSLSLCAAIAEIAKMIYMFCFFFSVCKNSALVVHVGYWDQKQAAQIKIRWSTKHM